MFRSRFLAVVVATFFTPYTFSQPITKITENIEASYYIRGDSVRKSGDSVEFWLITDFKRARQNKKGESYLSIDQRLVINCGDSTQVLTFVKVYSSPMTAGNLIANGAMSQRNKIPAGTSLEIIKEFVCR